MHTPEFGFERNVDNIVRAARSFGVGFPIAIDPDYGVWSEFANHFWPAVHIADVEGRIRYHHFGEGEYAAIEMVIQQLLIDAGVEDVDQDLVDVDPVGSRWPPTGGRSGRPSRTSGHGQSAGFAQDASARFDEPSDTPHPRGWPSTPGPSSGTWTVARHAAVLNEPGGRVAFRFHARDVNLVMGPLSKGASIPFRVFLDGQAAQAFTGPTSTPTAAGSSHDQRTYQLIRQSGPIADRTFEIEFLDPGAEAYCFTFG